MSITEKEWRDLTEWANGTFENQQNRIISVVLKQVKKSKRPHIKELIERAFKLAAIQYEENQYKPLKQHLSKQEVE